MGAANTGYGQIPPVVQVGIGQRPPMGRMDEPELMDNPSEELAEKKKKRVKKLPPQVESKPQGAPQQKRNPLDVMLGESNPPSKKNPVKYK